MDNWREDVADAADAFYDASRSSGNMSPSELIRYIIKSKKEDPLIYPGILKIAIDGECAVIGFRRGGSKDTEQRSITWGGFYTGVYKTIREIGY